MMNQAVKEFDRASGKVVGDFRTIITDSEDLLKAAATVSGESFLVAREKFERKLTLAKAALADASKPVIDKTREAAAATNDYVNTNPWTTVGIALAAGLMIGMLAAKR